MVKFTSDNREILLSIEQLKSLITLPGVIIIWGLFCRYLETIDYCTDGYGHYDPTERDFFKHINDIFSDNGILKRAAYYYQESNKVHLEREETLNDLFSPQRLLEQQELWDNE